MTLTGALAHWEARFATSGEDRARLATWRLDDGWAAACREASARDSATVMRAAEHLVAGQTRTRSDAPTPAPPPKRKRAPKPNVAVALAIARMKREVAT